MQLDARVDMLELKDYGEIDPDETPVIALACGHFFTAETLDGTSGRVTKPIFVYISLFPDGLAFHP